MTTLNTLNALGQERLFRKFVIRLYYSFMTCQNVVRKPSEVTCCIALVGGIFFIYDFFLSVILIHHTALPVQIFRWQKN